MARRERGSEASGPRPIAGIWPPSHNFRTPMASYIRALVQGAAIGAVGGASLETFMVYTGFYKVATRKAAEHRVEDRAMLQAAAQRRRRLSDLRPGATPALAPEPATETQQPR